MSPTEEGITVTALRLAILAVSSGEQLVIHVGGGKVLTPPILPLVLFG